MTNDDHNILRIFIIGLFFAIITVFLHFGIYDSFKYILGMILFGLGILYIIHGSIPMKFMGLLLMLMGLILTPIGSDLTIHFLNNYVAPSPPKSYNLPVDNGSATSGGLGVSNDSGSGSFLGGSWLFHIFSE